MAQILTKKLHPKIQELKNNLDSSPIRKSQPIQTVNIIDLNKDQKDERTLEQYFAVWDQVDDWGTRPVKGFFKKSIEDRGPKSNATDKIVMLWQHNQSDPLCKPIEIIEDEIGLRAKYRPDEGIESCDRCVIQVRSGTINNGSYGFNYVWDKMEYNTKDECIDMYEGKVFELSPVTLASQGGTFAVRGQRGHFDEHLIDETEKLLKKVPRQFQLELRSIIDRHITLASEKPLHKFGKALIGKRAAAGKIDYKKLAMELEIGLAFD